MNQLDEITESKLAGQTVIKSHSDLGNVSRNDVVMDFGNGERRISVPPNTNITINYSVTNITDHSVHKNNSYNTTLAGGDGALKLIGDVLSLFK